MSRYINFYVKLEDKYLNLVSFTGSSDIYNEFYENLNIDNNITELNSNDVNQILSDIKERIKFTESRIAEFEKHCSGNIDIISDIIDNKCYLQDLYEVYNKISFILDIIYDCNAQLNSFDGLYINLS